MTEPPTRPWVAPTEDGADDYFHALRRMDAEEAFALACLVEDKLTMRELAALRWEEVDRPRGLLRVGDPVARSVRMSPLTAWILSLSGAEWRFRRGPFPSRAAAHAMASYAREIDAGPGPSPTLTQLRRAHDRSDLGGAELRAAWARRARRALAVYDELAGTAESAHACAFVAASVGRLDGWTHSGARRYLRDLMAQRNPDGGFGLGREYDAFSTGDVNSADTTYTVTLAGHVGRVLLEAHSAGVVGLTEVDRVVRLLVDAPRVRVEHGACVGYSQLRRDAAACVNNVNAQVGLFLEGARRAGSREPGLAELLALITQCQAAHFVPDEASWTYIEGRSTPNDFSHEAACIEAALVLTPPIGRLAGMRFMRRRDYGKWTDPLGQVRLARSYPSRRASLLSVFDGMLQDSRMTSRLAAQFAYWSSALAIN